ncbi:carboxypeptidase-like regulatory domain-containing protein [Chryseobacterium antibioticum]|uniref:Carboxypeptidase-like regulatory domain-containing protein n=1 Tax=Chryseobacterium pyrolae TaxID=2987481 RepID=A0ABT2IHE3_9FLAO|nr:carboxypeptidase-like regulatory domain-containing protein [Chryseobacterium pyrolae]MCT2408072.1 carboxypeptidase-like regulatory domain-containing protein [Chryseobacterium pyrolae]
MRKTIFFSAGILLLTSCTGRIKTPDITGTVYEAHTLKPLENAEIYLDEDSKTKTDAQGRFHIGKKMYSEKISVGGEAPPVIYKMTVSKKEYKDTIIHYKNLFGGGNKNLTVKYDSIVLKKK